MENIDENNSNDYHLLNNANHLKMHEDLLVYTVFGIFWAANILLVIGIFQTDKKYFDTALIIISVIGFFLSIFWWYIINCLLKYHTFYEHLVDEIEKKLNVPIELRTGKDNPKFQIFISNSFLKSFLKIIPIIFMFFWLINLLIIALNVLSVTSCHKCGYFFIDILGVSTHLMP